VLAARLGLRGTPVEMRALRAAYFRSPLWTPAKLREALRLLDVLARLFGEALARRPARPVAAESPHVARARAYVHQHLGERLTTREVAQSLGLSDSYFCRHFRRLTGLTFHAYLAQARVEAAKTKLLDTWAPITEICYVSGFQSVSDFNRVFKARVGTSPSKFRRAARQHSNRR
jgi:AraC-like DNA-binding protein